MSTFASAVVHWRPSTAKTRTAANCMLCLVLKRHSVQQEKTVDEDNHNSNGTDSVFQVASCVVNELTTQREQVTWQDLILMHLPATLRSVVLKGPKLNWFIWCDQHNDKLCNQTVLFCLQTAHHLNIPVHQSSFANKWLSSYSLSHKRLIPQTKPNKQHWSLIYFFFSRRFE